MHTRGRPVSVRVTAFEPMPGEPGMSIFLEGHREFERFYYRLYMMGTASKGYMVGGLYGRADPFPHSALRTRLDVLR
jgi:hypothetical protein